MKTPILPLGVVIACLAVVAPRLPAATRNWKAATTGDWFAAGNWVEETCPSDGDDAVVGNPGASVLLTNSTAPLSSLTLSRTLVFSNWNTTLSATNVIIQNAGLITLASAFKTGEMSNNVFIVCSNLTLEAGGLINADGKGHSGGRLTGVNGYGPGGTNAAGGYGGVGGGAALTYGQAEAPLDPGSGGRCGNGTYAPQGNGGGAVRIEASGTVTVNGLITANGENTYGNYSSYPGSGGGVYIRCVTFAGTYAGPSNGTINANGGMQSHYGHAGGGGRIAVLYTNLAAGVPTVQISAAGGRRWVGADSFLSPPVSDIGTLYFPDARILTEILPHSGQLIIPGFTNWSTNTLVVSNGWIRFPAEGFHLAVSNDVIVCGTNARLELGGNRCLFKTSAYGGDNIYSPRPLYFIYTATNGPLLTCGGNLVLTNGGNLHVYSGMTNGTDYGALVQASGDIVITGSNSWIYPHSHPTNGGSPRFQMRNLAIQANSGFNADSAGYITGLARPAFGYGPGATNGGAGTHGGAGYYNPVAVYGSAAAPIDSGSAGRNGGDYIAAPGGNGGGVIRIEADGTIDLDGILSANGEYGQGVYGSWPGGGGTVSVICNILTGSQGTIRANGGPAETGNGSYGGGGGGGRIAVVYTNSAAQRAAGVPGIVFSAAGGTGYGPRIGDVGSLYFPDTSLMGPILPHSGQLEIPGFTNWAPDTLTISNGWLRFPADGFVLSVTNDVVINGAAARLDMGGRAAILDCGVNRFLYSPAAGLTLTCGGSLLLTNSSLLCVYAGPTNSSTPNYGALVSVARSMRLATNCWVYPYSHPTNGGSVRFVVGNMTIASNAGFNADAKGFLRGLALHTAGYGPGGGIKAGSYGGLGGGAVSGTYGSSNAPIDAGSGGYSGDYSGALGGIGGGVIWIEAASYFTLNGVLTAKGSGAGHPVYNSRSGSGGGIYVVCKKLITTAGTNAVLSAAGGGIGTNGDGGTGGGGGGRIAVWRVSDDTQGALTMNTAGGLAGLWPPNGPWPNGNSGTLSLGLLPTAGTVISLY